MWAYTQELASGRILDGETAQDAVLRVASVKLGYVVPEDALKFVARLLVGSSEGGESEYLYYAECKEADRVEKWAPMEGVERISIPRWSASYRLCPSSSPPSVLVLKAWLLWNERRPTEAENETARGEKQRLRLQIQEAERATKEAEFAERLAKWTRDQAEKEAAAVVAAVVAKEAGGAVMEEGEKENEGRKRVGEEKEEVTELKRMKIDGEE